MSSLNVSTVADYVTIINFVVSIIILIGASISKKLRAWISSILTECLKKHLNETTDSENIDKDT